MRSADAGHAENRRRMPESGKMPLSSLPDAGQESNSNLQQKIKKQNSDKDRERRENTFSFSVRNTAAAGGGKRGYLWD